MTRIQLKVLPHQKRQDLHSLPHVCMAAYWTTIAPSGLVMRNFASIARRVGG